MMVRVLAGRGTGGGHLMRCLALAQLHRRRGGRVLFLTPNDARPLWPRLIQEGIEVLEVAADPGSREDVEVTLAAARSMGATWIVCDGYALGRTFQHNLRKGGMRVVKVDDHGRSGPHDCDVLVDPNLDPVPAAGRPNTRFLGGPRYALLRQEFLRPRQRQKLSNRVRVLVTFGAADLVGATAVTLRALAQCRTPHEANVLVGPLTEDLEAIHAAAAQHPLARLHRDAPDLSRLMDEADLAVTAGGSTVWELAHASVAMALMPVADNQVPVAVALTRAGAGVLVGRHGAVDEARLVSVLDGLLADETARASLGTGGACLVDGRGAARVLAVMGGMDLHLRPVGSEDARLLFEWANDPEVRRQSFRSRPIDWDGHVAWLKRKLADPRCRLLLASLDGQPVGQVRFEVEGDVALIGISVAPGTRGKGWGAALLDAATCDLFRTTSAAKARGLVKASNTASQEAFLAAGFRAIQAQPLYEGVPVLVFERDREAAVAGD